MKLNLPKLKLPKLKKRQKQVFILSLIILGIFFTAPYMFSGSGEIENYRDLFNYAEPTYNIVPLAGELQAGQTVQAQLYDIDVSVRWTGSLSIRPQTIKCTLIGGLLNNYVDNGGYVSADSDYTYHWTFGLTEASVGTYDYHFEFTGYYPDATTATDVFSDSSFYFKISNLIQTIDPPEITVRPSDVTITTVESATLTWKYVYNAESTLRLKQNDSVIVEQAGLVGIQNQTYQYHFSPTEIGDYIFEFSIDPTNNQATVKDTVMVHVITPYDDVLIDGVPDAALTCVANVRGTISGINIQNTQSWGCRNAPPMIFPRAGMLTVDIYVLRNQLYRVFGAVSLIVYDSHGDRTEYVMSDQFDWKALFTVDVDEAWQVKVDLSNLQAGEYTFEIHGRSGGDWYKLTSFSLAVRMFPVSWIIQNAMWLGLIAFGLVMFIRFAREAKGWWEFKGRYKR